MKGRKPVPTTLKVLNGNPGQRPINQNEPKPTPIAPDAPSWLSGRAKEIWQDHVPKMERIGLIAETDSIVMANLCQEQADMERRQAVINEKGDTIMHENTKGAANEVSRPEAIMIHKGRQLIKSYCAELGLTVSSRSRIQVPGHEEEDEMEQLLSR